MKKELTTILVLMSSLVTGQVNVGIFGGMENLNGDLPERPGAGKKAYMEPFAGLYFEKGLSDRFGLGLQGGYGSYGMKGMGEGFRDLRGTLFEGTVVGRWELGGKGFRPFLEAGAGAVHYRVHTDLENAQGTEYHYWSDGTIRDRKESHENRFTAQEIKKDGEYETRIGQGTDLVIPLGGGIRFDLGKKIKADVMGEYDLHTQEDFDGHDGGGFFGDGMVRIKVRLFFRSKQKTYLEEWKASYGMNPDTVYSGDEDSDGVPDEEDLCVQTPEKAEVDKDGCPLDSDGDGVPDHRDLEKGTEGKYAHWDGFGIKDNYWKIQRMWYTDSLFRSSVLDSIDFGHHLVDFHPYPYIQARSKAKADTGSVRIKRNIFTEYKKGRDGIIIRYEYEKVRKEIDENGLILKTVMDRFGLKEEEDEKEGP